MLSIKSITCDDAGVLDWIELKKVDEEEYLGESVPIIRIKEKIHDILSGENNLCLVGYLGMESIGYIRGNLDKQSSSFYIQKIFVKEKHRNMGFGTQITKCLLSRISRENIHLVGCQLLAENLASKRVQEKVGAILKDDRGWITAQINLQN